VGARGTTAISMQLVAMVSIFTPARGAMVHFGLAGIDGLPVGSGTYFTEAFDATTSTARPCCRSSG
jgi:hypothetical protein